MELPGETNISGRLRPATHTPRGEPPASAAGVLFPSPENCKCQWAQPLIGAQWALRAQTPTAQASCRLALQTQAGDGILDHRNSLPRESALNEAVNQIPQGWSTSRALAVFGSFQKLLLPAAHKGNVSQLGQPWSHGSHGAAGHTGAPLGWGLVSLHGATAIT